MMLERETTNLIRSCVLLGTLALLPLGLTACKKQPAQATNAVQVELSPSEQVLCEDVKKSGKKLLQIYHRLPLIYDQIYDQSSLLKASAELSTLREELLVAAEKLRSYPAPAMKVRRQIERDLRDQHFKVHESVLEAIEAAESMPDELSKTSLALLMRFLTEDKDLIATRVLYLTTDHPGLSDTRVAKRKSTREEEQDRPAAATNSATVDSAPKPAGLEEVPNGENDVQNNDFLENRNVPKAVIVDPDEQ